MKRDRYMPDNGKMPILFESAKRVNERYYGNWGMERGRYRSESDDRYTKEWKGGPEQMKNVANAAINSGVGSFSVSLRNRVARNAAYIAHNAEGNVRILDVGAGGGRSAKPVYSCLPESEWDKVYFMLIDPSGKNVRAAKEYLSKTLGLKEGKHFDVVRGKDTEIPEKVDGGSFDVASQVAAIHHHAYLSKPFECVAHALKKSGLKISGLKGSEKYGGVFNSGDWHSRIWESPAIMYRMLLEKMDWPEKEKGIKSFLEQFPNASDPLPGMGCFDLRNMEVFTRYWETWSNDRQKLIREGNLRPENDFYGMEGHCPEWIYGEEMLGAGFLLDTPLIGRIIEDGLMDDNPDQVNPDHNLNMIILGQIYDKEGIKN